MKPTGSATEAETVAANLRKLVPPTFDEVFADRKIEKGKSTKFECIVNGQPTPKVNPAPHEISIIWYSGWSKRLKLLAHTGKNDENVCHHKRIWLSLFDGTNVSSSYLWLETEFRVRCQKEHRRQSAVTASFSYPIFYTNRFLGYPRYGIYCQRVAVIARWSELNMWLIVLIISLIIVSPSKYCASNTGKISVSNYFDRCKILQSSCCRLTNNFGFAVVIVKYQVWRIVTEKARQFCDFEE